jgi:membrane-bound lytic murein transglycosylase D
MLKLIKTTLGLLCIGLCWPIGCGNAQTIEFDLGEAVDRVNEWALENVDREFLQSLGEPDREKVQLFLASYVRVLQSSNVLDLASLRSSATNIIPILERYEESSPYAAWLRTRVDYFEVAGELQRTLPVPPPRAQTPAASIVNLERKVWVKKLSEKPLPPGAVKWADKLKKVFITEKVPPQLVWIAEVESSFDPDARSPVGAAGLFQLMPATAKQYGLRRWPFDQRYQPEPSAAAAARYLRALYREFGDWQIVLAAYNAGDGRVRGLLKRYNAKTYDQIAARLPAETQMYVPKVEAALMRREAIRLSELR